MFSSIKYIEMSQPNNENEYQESNSIVLNLESLSAQYRNKLIEYQFAVANYVNYLREEAATPCGQYTGNSTNIDQRCYNEIWTKSGCTTSGVVNASTSWAQGMTLNGLIQDSWYWSTLTDYNHRMGCYGNPGNPYTIIGIGTDGRLWSRQGLDAPWQQISDNSSGVQGICTMNDGKGLLGTGGYNIYTKTSYSANWSGPVQYACCVTSIAMGQDGTVVGVGTDNKLWSKTNLNSNWTQTASPGEWISSICIAPDGSLFCIGSNNAIFKKNSYQNLANQQWQYLGNNTCCVKAITIAPDGTFIGVGTDNQLYTKANYQDLSTPWQGPFNSQNGSCCVTGITTVANQNYNASNYNKSSQPNYNINQQNMSAVAGATYWGTSAISQNNSATLQECQALCASTNGCTGATFNATAHGQPMCWLRGGTGSISPGLDTDYAIVPKGQQLLSIVQSINQELTNINQQIQQKSEAGQPLYDAQSQQRRGKTFELIGQFIQLNEERDRINKMLDDYKTLDQEQNQGNIMINQNYYSFILLLGLAILVIIILYKFGMPQASQSNPPLMQTGGELGINAYYIVFAIILVILIINFIYKRYYF
jgi:hypothetical protein